MTAWLKALFKRRVWEPLRLAEAEERALRYAPEQHERVRSFAKGALVRLRSGRQLRDEQGLIAALSLYRESARLALSGFAAARDSSASDLVLGPDKALAALDEAVTEDALAPRDGVARLRQLLTLTDPLALDRLGLAERRELALAAERAIPRILAAFEPRTLPELRVARVVRATLAVAGAVTVSAGLVMALTGTTQPNNASSADLEQPAAKAVKANRPKRPR